MRPLQAVRNYETGVDRGEREGWGEGKVHSSAKSSNPQLQVQMAQGCHCLWSLRYTDKITGIMRQQVWVVRHVFVQTRRQLLQQRQE